MNASGSVDLIRVARKNKSLRYGIAHVELHPSTVGCQCRASQQIRELYQRRPPLGSRFGASVANSQPTTSEWYSGYFLRLTASKFAGQPSDLRILSRGRGDAVSSRPYSLCDNQRTSILGNGTHSHRWHAGHPVAPACTWSVLHRS
jgi:hypothetical protein